MKARYMSLKTIIILIILFYTILGIIAIMNTIRLKKLRKRAKKKKYHTPKVSSLHGKKFKDYIDNLTENSK